MNAIAEKRGIEGERPSYIRTTLSARIRRAHVRTVRFVIGSALRHTIYGNSHLSDRRKIVDGPAGKKGWSAQRATLLVRQVDTDSHWGRAIRNVKCRTRGLALSVV